MGFLSVSRVHEHVLSFFRQISKRDAGSFCINNLHLLAFVTSLGRFSESESSVGSAKKTRRAEDELVPPSWLRGAPHSVALAVPGLFDGRGGGLEIHELGLASAQGVRFECSLSVVKTQHLKFKELGVWSILGETPGVRAL